MRLAAGLRPDPLGKLERSPRPSSRNWGRVPTSKEKGREGNGKREGRGWQGEERKGKGRRERADPRPGLRNVKVATLKCGGPTTMPEEHRGPWSKKFENRCHMAREFP